MQWSDKGFVLGARRFGEAGLILDVLTAEQGRRSGLVYGGASRKRRAQFEPGNTLDLAWSGRLEGQLGRFNVAEVVTYRAPLSLDRPRVLCGLSAVCSLLAAVIDEGDRETAALYEPTSLLLDAITELEAWPALYARWELGLLSTLGFGLDLETCAVSGANDGLTHVSPKSGRAVRGSEAEGYLDKLLPLPGFLLDPTAPADNHQVASAMKLTGYFLEKRVFAPLNRALPPARDRLISMISGSRPNSA